MNLHWSSQCVWVEHKDLQANSMALAESRQIIALSGRRCVGLVDMNNPTNIIKKFVRHSKWDVGASEWCPFQSESLALACNQRAEILTYHDGDLTSTCMLKAHTRAISDLNWSPFDPHILATASIDASIHLWDLREQRKPSTTFTTVAGASQVKWNKVREELLATAHDGDVRLWDTRNSSQPIFYLGAHLSKIHGLDWSPACFSELCTACQDCTVKFWCIDNEPKKPLRQIYHTCSVWRARYTPFLDGVITVGMPQLGRGENSLALWNLGDLSAPVHTFVGPSDVVLEFGWRAKENINYELMAWCKDQSLRIWNVDPQLQKLCQIGDHQNVFCGGGAGSETPIDSLASEAGMPIGAGGDDNTDEPKLPSSPIDPPCRSPPSPLVQAPHTLQQEFALVNLNIPNLSINELDAQKRTCTVMAVCGKLQVCIQLIFPLMYPNNAPPTFQFVAGTTVDPSIKQKLIKVLMNVANSQVRRNRSCLEPCLRQLVSSLEHCIAEENNHIDHDTPIHESLPKQRTTLTYGSFRDANVPFPRTSGARFCGADLLVCFQRPPHLQKMNAPTEVTPRSLSALNAYLATHIIIPSAQSAVAASTSPSSFPFSFSTTSPTGDGVSIASFYQQDGPQDPLNPKLRAVGATVKRHLESDGRKKSVSATTYSYCGPVLMFSVAKLLPISFELAQKYELGGSDLPSLCSRNSSYAAEEGRWDLVQIWNIAAEILHPSVQPTSESDINARPWALYPLCRPLIQSQIEHYLKIHDIQTVAMLCCIYGAQDNENLKAVRAVPEISGSGPGGSPYHTVVPADTSLDGWNIVSSNLRRNRSNSWSDALDEMSRILDPRSADGFTDLDSAFLNNIRYLDPAKNAQYDLYKQDYAEILYRWNLLEQRAQVLKHCTTLPQIDKCRLIDLKAVCQHCGSDTPPPQCGTCKRVAISCIVCRRAVRGLSMVCIFCCHGGHTAHIVEWFETNDTCPTGCGCPCAQLN